MDTAKGSATVLCDDHRTTDPRGKLELLQGTLDLMVLQTLDSMGPQHGYGLARRIEQVSEDILKLNEGTVYAALMRLQHRRWIWRAGGPPRTIARRSSTPSRPPAGGNWRVKSRPGTGSRA